MGREVYNVELQTSNFESPWALALAIDLRKDRLARAGSFRCSSPELVHRLRLDS